MNIKLIILEILKSNPEIGRQKFDRIYYAKVDYSKNWVDVVKELRIDGLIEEDKLGITQKGLDFLKKHSQ